MQSGKRARRTQLLFAVIALSLMTLRHVHGADLDASEKALEIIGNFADRTCTKIPLEVESRKVELSGEAKAGLNEVLRKIGNLGIQGGGRYQNEASKGPLREELAQSIKNSDDCRLAVFNKLTDKLLPAGSSNELGSEPGSPQHQSQDLERKTRENMYSQTAARAAEEAATNMLNGSADGLSVPFCDRQLIYNNENVLHAALSKLRRGSGPINVSAVGVQSVVDYMGRENNLIERGGYNRYAAIHPCGQQNVVSTRDYAVEIQVRFLNSGQEARWVLIVDRQSGLAKAIF